MRWLKVSYVLSRTGAFAFDSLLNRLISLSFARQLHERLFPGPESRQLSDEVFALLRTVQHLLSH